MIQHVSFERTTFNELPYKFEAGTPDYIGTHALATALDYVSNLGMKDIEAYEHELTRYATERLQAIEGMRIFGTTPDKGSVISFLVGDIHHFDLGTLLDRLGIAVRTATTAPSPSWSVWASKAQCVPPSASTTRGRKSTHSWQASNG